MLDCAPDLDPVTGRSCHEPVRLDCEVRDHRELEVVLDNQIGLLGIDVTPPESLLVDDVGLGERAVAPQVGVLH